MVYILARKNRGSSHHATITMTITPDHSQLAIASPTRPNAELDIPTKCSVEILEAIKEKPINGQISFRPVRK